MYVFTRASSQKNKLFYLSYLSSPDVLSFELFLQVDDAAAAVVAAADHFDSVE